MERGNSPKTTFFVQYHGHITFLKQPTWHFVRVAVLLPHQKGRLATTKAEIY